MKGTSPKGRGLWLAILAPLAMILASCGWSHKAQRKSPPSPAIFVVVDSEVRLLDERGTMVERFPTPIARGYSVMDSNADRVFIYSDHVIYEVSMMKRSTEVFARLPRLTGCEDKELPPLTLQSNLDLGLTSDGTSLCVRLMDRNLNMMSLAVEYRVDLESQRVASALTADMEGLCGMAEQESICTVDTMRSYPYSVADITLPEGVMLMDQECLVRTPSGWLVPVHDKAPCDIILEGVSPTGRFIAVSSTPGEGDYVWRQLDFIDIKRGVLLKELRTEVVGASRIEWAPGRDDVLVDEKLLLLNTIPQIITLNASAAFLNGPWPFPPQ